MIKVCCLISLVLLALGCESAIAQQTEQKFNTQKIQKLLDRGSIKPAGQGAEVKNQPVRSDTDIFNEYVANIQNSFDEQKAKRFPVLKKSGVAHLTFELNRNGEIRSVKIKKSSGDAEIDSSVLNFAKSLSFPAMPTALRDEKLSIDVKVSTDIGASVPGSRSYPTTVGNDKKSIYIRAIADEMAKVGFDALRLPRSADLKINFELGPEGVTKSVKIAKSSGDTEVDKTVVERLSGLKLTPRPADLDKRDWKFTVPVKIEVVGQQQRLAVHSRPVEALVSAEKRALNLELGKQVKKCWNPPPPVKGQGIPPVRLSWKLGQDGKLLGEPTWADIAIDSGARVALNAAIDAVKRCQPYSLGQFDYADWQHVSLLFTVRH